MKKKKIGKPPNKTQERVMFLMDRTGCTMNDAFNSLNKNRDNLVTSQIELEKMMRERRAETQSKFKNLKSPFDFKKE